MEGAIGCMCGNYNSITKLVECPPFFKCNFISVHREPSHFDQKNPSDARQDQRAHYLHDLPWTGNKCSLKVVRGLVR